MSDAEIEQKREEDERLDTAEDPNEEVRGHSTASSARAITKHNLLVSHPISTSSPISIYAQEQKPANVRHRRRYPQ
mgnify:CR=1 FL=1